MNAELLLAHFDRIIHIPGAVPRLRQVVRELAVRGKLVDQLPDEESALKLMRGLASRRSIPRGLDVTSDPLAGDAVPFQIPSN